MKTERLTDGVGYPVAPKTYYFDGVYFYFVKNSQQEIVLIGKKANHEVVSVSINRSKKTFEVMLASGSPLHVEHLYAIERLFQSYALTFGFSIIQVVIPMYDALESLHGVMYGGDLEIFPSISGE